MNISSISKYFSEHYSDYVYRPSLFQEVKSIEPVGECTITTISFKVLEDVDPDRIFEIIPDSVA
jgi:transaldolase